MPTVLKDLKSKIVSIDSIPIYAKCLIYGDPGAGKTRLSCTAPKPLVLLTELSTSEPTIRQVYEETGNKADIWNITDLDELWEAYEFLLAGNHNYQTVILDSLTDLNRMVIRGSIELAVSKRPSHDPDIPEQGDWYRAQESLRRIVRNFRDLPMDVVFTTLALYIKDDLKTVPALQPKSIISEIPSYCNLVGYLEVTEKNGVYTRNLRVTPNEFYIGKNPGGRLPDVVENPNLSDIFQKVKSNKNNLKEDVLNA